MQPECSAQGFFEGEEHQGSDFTSRTKHSRHSNTIRSKTLPGEANSKYFLGVSELEAFGGEEEPQLWHPRDAGNHHSCQVGALFETQKKTSQQRLVRDPRWIQPGCWKGFQSTRHCLLWLVVRRQQRNKVKGESAATKVAPRALQPPPGGQGQCYPSSSAASCHLQTFPEVELMVPWF